MKLVLLFSAAFVALFYFFPVQALSALARIVYH